MFYKFNGIQNTNSLTFKNNGVQNIIQATKILRTINLIKLYFMFVIQVFCKFIISCYQ